MEKIKSNMTDTSDLLISELSRDIDRLEIFTWADGNETIIPKDHDLRIILNGFVPKKLFSIFDYFINNQKKKWKVFNTFFTIMIGSLHIDFWKQRGKKYNKWLKRKKILIPSKRNCRRSRRPKIVNTRSTNN